MDCSPSDSSVHGILGWVAIPTLEIFWPREWTHVSCIFFITGIFFTPGKPRPPLLEVKILLLYYKSFLFSLFPFISLLLQFFLFSFSLASYFWKMLISHLVDFSYFLCYCSSDIISFVLFFFLLFLHLCDFVFAVVSSLWIVTLYPGMAIFFFTKVPFLSS